MMVRPDPSVQGIDCDWHRLRPAALGRLATVVLLVADIGMVVVNG
jgi:hypothetical protein